jgi:hypothetical protein
MILHVLTDSRQIQPDLDSLFRKLLGWTDTRKHKQLGCGIGARAQNYFVIGECFLECSSFAFNIFNADRLTSFKQYPRGKRFAFKRKSLIFAYWIDKTPHGAASPTLIRGRLHKTDTFLAAAVDVGNEVNLESLKRLEKGTGRIAYGMMRIRNLEWTVDSVGVVI